MLLLGGGTALGAVVRGVKVACLAMHAGAAGVAPGAEVTWNYGPLYSRRYKVGAGCDPVPVPPWEVPARYFGCPTRVPEDAYRLD